MSSEEASHVACVEAWVHRAANGPARAHLIGSFERAVNALWRRAEVTLGVVTLTAIVDRVLYTASERYPLLSTLKVEDAGVRFDEFREQGAATHDGYLVEAARFVLIEFLAVLGNLTAEILTPALHAELSKVTVEDGEDDAVKRARSGSAGATNDTDDGKGTRS